MGSRNWSGIPNASDGSRSTVYTAISKDVEGVSGKYFIREIEKLPTEIAGTKQLTSKLWN